MFKAGSALGLRWHKNSSGQQVLEGLQLLLLRDHACNTKTPHSFAWVGKRCHRYAGNPCEAVRHIT